MSEKFKLEVPNKYSDLVEATAEELKIDRSELVTLVIFGLLSSAILEEWGKDNVEDALNIIAREHGYEHREKL